MDKQNWKSAKAKINTTSTMKELINGESQKGYSSSSHYRINNDLSGSEQPLATKFVQWDVTPLESLQASKVYLLRVKLNSGERLSREEKNWLCEAVNSNSYFHTAVPLQGWRFDFFDVLKKYLVNQYGQWAEYYAPDRTSLRAYLCVRINQIVEIPKF
jgi:hypothetical protein